MTVLVEDVEDSEEEERFTRRSYAPISNELDEGLLTPLNFE